MIKRAVLVAVLVSLITIGVSPGFSQANAKLKNYLSQTLKLSQDQIASIQNGQPYAQALRVPHPGRDFRARSGLHQCGS